jgi:hypothetical protein
MWTFDSSPTRRAGAALAGVVLSAAIGCSATSDPPLAATDVAGTYALRSASGVPLPLLELQTGSQASLILADTLTLTANGDLTYRTTRARSFFRPGLPQSHDTVVSIGAGTWHARGRALALVYLIPGEPYTDTLPASRLPDASLQVLRGFQYPTGDTLRYTRVP